jgi:type I restriction enzyme S subunit
MTPPTDWQEFRLAEFLEINPKVAIDNNKEYSFIEMSDLNPGYKNVSPKRKRQGKGLTKFESKDTLFAKITPCLENGKICQAIGLDGDVGVGSTEFIVFRGKEGISDSDFAYYLLNYNPVKNFAIKNMTGTAGQQRVPVTVFGDLRISLPKLEEQKKIASVLSALDDKISLLWRQNETLEQMAQAIYRHWFVDFEFPDENGKPYKSSGGKLVPSELGDIPAGWRIGTLESITNNFDRKRVPLSSIERETRKGSYPYYGASGIIDFVDDYLYDGEYILFSEDGENLRSRKTPIVFIASGRFWVNNHAHVLNGKQNIYFYFIYLYLMSKDISKILTGAVQPKVTKSNLNSLMVPKPTEMILKKFDGYVRDIFKKIECNLSLIKQLAKVRNFLLPKLMSGKIRMS